MKWHDVQQNSDEWFDLRRGKFTASMFGELMMGKSTIGYDKAVCRVAYEMLTDESPEFYASPYMDRGHELEPLGVMAYEMRTFETATNGGFFEMSEFVGASPDRLIGSNGILQVKCPAFHTMMNYLRNPSVPKEYEWQLQGELYVTGREWVDFMAFHPMLPDITIRVNPVQEMQDRIKEELETAIQSAKDLVKLIRDKQKAF